MHKYTILIFNDMQIFFMPIMRLFGVLFVKS